MDNMGWAPTVLAAAKDRGQSGTGRPRQQSPQLLRGEGEGDVANDSKVLRSFKEGMRLGHSKQSNEYSKTSGANLVQDVWSARGSLGEVHMEGRVSQGEKGV